MCFLQTFNEYQSQIFLQTFSDHCFLQPFIENQSFFQTSNDNQSFLQTFNEYQSFPQTFNDNQCFLQTFNEYQSFPQTFNDRQCFSVEAEWGEWGVITSREWWPMCGRGRGC